MYPFLYLSPSFHKITGELLEYPLNAEILRHSDSDDVADHAEHVDQHRDAVVHAKPEIKHIQIQIQ